MTELADPFDWVCIENEPARSVVYHLDDAGAELVTFSADIAGQEAAEALAGRLNSIARKQGERAARQAALDWLAAHPASAS
jgi:hypothetical protein